MTRTCAVGLKLQISHSVSLTEPPALSQSSSPIMQLIKFVGALWVVLAATVVSAQKDAPPEDQDIVVFPGIDFFGGDLGKAIKTKSDDECNELCKKEPECIAWTRTKNTKCYLKNIRNEASLCDHCTASGMVVSRQTTSSCGTGDDSGGGGGRCFLVPGIDFRGSILKAPVVTNSDSDCCDMCHRDPKCIGWTRTRKGVCWLKKGLRKAVRCDECTATGMIFSRQPPTKDEECVEFPGIDFFGNDIGKGINTDSDEECCKLCLDEPTCVGWTRTIRDKCYIKNVLSAATICEHCTASGVIVSRQAEAEASCSANGCTFIPGIDFFDGDIGKGVKTDSDEECCELCQANPKCLAWTRIKSGLCWIKDKQTPPVLCKKCSASGYIGSRHTDEETAELRAEFAALDLKKESKFLQTVVGNILAGGSCYAGLPE